jgi:drug/metabolite transporter (DMT)-like permease
MQLYALICILFAVVGTALQPIWWKWLEKKFSVLELLTLNCGISTLVCFLAYFLLPFWGEINVTHSDATLFWLAVGFGTLISIVIWYSDLSAIRVADVSFAAPIYGMTPGLVAMTAILFGEVPSIKGWIGISLIVAGTYVHSREGVPLKEYFVPLLFWRAFGNLDHLPKDERRKRLGLRFAYTGAACGSVGLICDGLISRYGNPALGISVEFALLSCVFFVWRSGQRAKEERQSFLMRVRNSWLSLLGLGVITAGLPSLLLAVGFAGAPIAYVGSMKRLWIVVAMLIAFWFLGELRNNPRRRTRRLLLGLLIVVGAALLALDPAQPHLIAGTDELLRRLFGSK